MNGKKFCVFGCTGGSDGWTGGCHRQAPSVYCYYQFSVLHSIEHRLTFSPTMIKADEQTRREPEDTSTDEYNVDYYVEIDSIKF